MSGNNSSRERLSELKGIIRKLLQEKFDNWVIKADLKLDNQIRFSESQIDIDKNWNELRFDLFLSKNRRTLEISLSDLRKEAIEETLTQCDKLLDSAKKNRFFKRLPEGPFSYDDDIRNKIFDKKVLNLEEDSINLVKKATEHALKEGAKRVAGSFFFGGTEHYLETSKGIEENYKDTHLNFRIRAFAEDMYATGESLTVSTHLDVDFDPLKAGKEAGEICRKAINGKKGEPGIYNIIIYPKVSTELQAPTPAIAMNRYVKKMGLSWLAGKREGDKIGTDLITVYDDGKVPYGLSSSPYDDEGFPTSRTLLIEKGVIKNYFRNISLSRRKEKSTGNAGITMPKPTNTLFMPGDCTLEELMEISEKPTLLITSTWYTRYQSYVPPGRFSSLPKDGMFLIKKRGRELEPVRELRINSNHYEMLENTIALGNTTKQVTTWLSASDNTVFAPFFLIKDIKMTTGTK
ncbi:MAG: putative Zn-dependent protease [Promethearchaeota archaeon]|nr:MAG: putative Zn-dependent protease [Candidatus Lokiarchaeota archaeon]